MKNLLPNLSFEDLQSINPLDVGMLMTLLKLPRERAERVVELAEKVQSGDITPPEFLELAVNVYLRKEQIYNDGVNSFCIKPFIGLEHLHPEDGKQGPSVNDLLREQFGEDIDVVEVADEAHENGYIYRSSNINYFHPDDVVPTEDAERFEDGKDFNIEPQIHEEDTEDAPADEDKGVTMTASEALGLGA